MRKDKIKIILIHLGIFIISSFLFFLFSDYLLKIIASGFSNVIIWLTLVKFGVFSLFIICVISCLIFIKKRTKKN